MTIAEADLTGDPRDADLLYHYTTPAGLLGIIESGTIWATDVAFLNDSRELHYGRAELQDEATAVIESIERHEKEDSAWGTIPYLRRLIEEVSKTSDEGGPSPGKTWVTCFCRKNDLLSQWRAYGISGGYSLGFDRAIISRLHTESGSWIPDYYDPLRRWTTSAGLDYTNVELIDVEYYDPDGDHSAVRESARAAIDALCRLRETATTDRYFHSSLYSGVYRTLARFKDWAFEEEQEVRLICTPEYQLVPKRAFRTGASGLIIPYTAIDASLMSSLKTITVGPGPDMRQRLSGIEQLLHAHDLGHVSIRESRVPFRG